MDDLIISDLARKITKDIFSCGEEINSPVSRIEFKGKKDEAGNEKAQGGLCFEALSDFIERSIKNYKD